MVVDVFLDSINNDNIRSLFRSATATAAHSVGVGKSGFKHGAVLTDGYSVVATGFNQYKTHPALREFTKWPFLHAESHALVRFGLDFCDGLLMVSVRIRKTGDIGMSRPCDVCKALMLSAGVRRVYYTTDTGFAYDNY